MPSAADIVSSFAIYGSVRRVQPFGSGHIHDTFRVRNAHPAQPDYLLQRINSHVFPRVPELMTNLAHVTAHIRQKLRNTPGADPDAHTLTLIPTHDGYSMHHDDTGNYWRMFRFIAGTHSIDHAPSSEYAFEAGKAIATFQAQLADFPVQTLYETIPDFHNVAKRMQQFTDVVRRNPVHRTEGVQLEIAFVYARADEMNGFMRVATSGQFPLRVTHNDTKLNNVLFDSDGKSVCLVDLDTVMPGYVHYDVGDAIRSIANPVAEDEIDLPSVVFDQALFTAVMEGYASMADFLTPAETEYLAFSPKLLTFIMGIRFLTDYLNGDVYYKIERDNHNLQRARVQFQLLRDMERQYVDMQRIVNRCFPVQA